MDTAQKLYEAGLITYMRTDSTNLSEDALNLCEKYIKSNYGKEYADKKTYTAKSKGAQEAHEAIRPTDIDKIAIDGSFDKDMQKLYNLIWKRTVASQMANAKINVQNIQIDSQNNNKSLLIFHKKQYYYEASLENIEFDGFLKLYDNSTEDDETVKGKLEVKANDLVEMQKIKVSEEYTKLPFRYNEAGLIKYLEKNGIGRPSTYASIISKIIDKNYVEIKNVDGVKKESKCIELSDKFKIKESTKEIVIGKESKKLVPTEIGRNINNFMMKNFEPVMDIKFTADFEEYLDKIAEGKAKWFNILNQFYQLFNPICEKLKMEVKQNPTKANSDKLIGINPENGLEIYTGVGQYGPYLKILEHEGATKWKYTALKDKEDVTLDEAIELLKYPKHLGKLNKTDIYLQKGPFGLYLKYGKSNISIKDKDIDEINFDVAKSLIESGDPYALQSFKVKDKIINVKEGQYGPYLQIVNGKTKSNVPIPKDYDIKELSLEEVLEIIASKNGTEKQYKPYNKKKEMNL